MMNKLSSLGELYVLILALYRRCWQSWSLSTIWWADTLLLVSKTTLLLNTWRNSSRYTLYDSHIKLISHDFLYKNLKNKTLWFTENGPKQRRCGDHWGVHRDLSEGIGGQRIKSDLTVYDRRAHCLLSKQLAQI